MSKSDKATRLTHCVSNPLIDMAENPLESLAAYSHFIAETLNRPSILRSTIRVWPTSPFTGTTEGEVFFSSRIRLRMREELDFADGLITSYGYEAVEEFVCNYYPYSYFRCRNWVEMVLILFGMNHSSLDDPSDVLLSSP